MGESAAADLRPRSHAPRQNQPVGANRALVAPVRPPRHRIPDPAHRSIRAPRAGAGSRSMPGGPAKLLRLLAIEVVRRGPAAGRERARADRGQPRLVDRHLRRGLACTRRASSPRARSATGRSPAGSRRSPARSSSAARAATTPRASTTSCTPRSPRATAWASFPRARPPRATRLLKFHSSLFEPAVANGARVQPVAIRYEYRRRHRCAARWASWAS